MAGVSTLGVAVTAYKTGRILGVHLRDLSLLSDVGKLALAAGVAGLLAALIRSLLIVHPPYVVFVICGLTFSLAYSGIVMLFGILTLEERRSLQRLAAQVMTRMPLRRAVNPST